MSDDNRAGRVHALDGLRGMAACAVVFYHAILHLEPGMINRVLYQPLQAAASMRDILTKLTLLCLNGEVAVFVFFVLSGCVLRRSLESKKDDSTASLSVRFILARLVRLYPPVIVCMLFFFALGRAGIVGYPVFPWSETLLNAALWRTLMHGPSTTVQAEVLAIPFILVVWLLRKSFGVAVLGIALIYTILAPESTWMVFSLPNMAGYLFPFIVGMLIAEPTLKPLLEKAPAGSWWAALACMLFCRTFASQVSIPSLIAMVLSAGMLVAGLLHGQRGSLARLLEQPIAQAFGRVSFSFYLLNVPMLYLIWAFTDRWEWPKAHALETGLFTGVLSILMTWPLAWASERWVERPSVAAGRWVWSIFRSNRLGDSSARDSVLMK